MTSPTTAPATQPRILAAPAAQAEPSALELELVVKLCAALEQQGISYCHWKSNNALDRSASGENDLDLLVSRGDAGRFMGLLGGLGFKPVQAPADKQMVGVTDYFGLDEASGRLVHVHAHFQLVMGHDMTKNIRLGIEAPYLASARRDGLFCVPAVEFEYVVFILRMMLKHCTWDAMLSGEGKLKASEQRELAWLQERRDPARVLDLLTAHLPFLDAALFRACERALEPGKGMRDRASTASRLQKLLQPGARYPAALDVFLKFWRRGTLMLQRRIRHSTPRYTPRTGGLMIAILGGDGAGKTTALSGLHAWLARTFETKRVHMGKPAWSPLTVSVRSVLKLGQLLRLYPLETSFEETLQQKSLVSPGYPYLIREVLRARDRFNTYARARRTAARGGVVLFDRFPMAQIELMDGMQAERFIRAMQAGPRSGQFLAPSMHSRFARWLVALEESYYRRIQQPDLLAVLRVHPDVAVARKTDESPVSVRRRSSEIWALEWEGTGVQVVDSSQPRESVLGALKVMTWHKM